MVIRTDVCLLNGGHWIQNCVAGSNCKISDFTYSSCNDACSKISSGLYYGQCDNLGCVGTGGGQNNIYYSCGPTQSCCCAWR